MRVLHIYKTSMPSSYGGVESFINNLCKADSLLGVKNTVLSLSKKPAEKPIELDGYTVHQARQDFFLASTGFSLSAFGKFKELSEQANIVHYHFPNPFADMLHMLCSPKKPSIVTYHSDIIKQKKTLYLYKPLKRQFLGSVDHIVTTSPNYFTSSKVLQNYANKVSIIPIGINHSHYENIDQVRLIYWRERLTEPFFLFVGAMRYYKGLHIALEAIAGTKIKVVLVGTNGVEKNLKAQAASLKLNNVEFLGSVSDQDKVALLHLCYGFIFPSHVRSEAFGISLLEAASVGKPMISCEIGTGTTFVNKPDETGIVIKPDSASELREAMQYLIDNPNTAAKMGESAKKRSRELFSVEQQARSYYDLYKNVLKNKFNCNGTEGRT